MSILSIVTYLFLSMVLVINIPDLSLFLFNLIMGAIGFSATLTTVSAIVAKTNNSMLMAILSFPIIIPMLLLLIKISNAACDGLGWASAYDELGALGAINMIVCSVTYLLFPYLWRA